MKRLLSYLKRNKITDSFAINSLFIKSFLRYHNLSVKKNDVLLKYLNENECYEDTLKHIEKMVEESGGNFNLETLIKMFEFVISPSDKIVNGAIYTPKEIRDRILDECVEGVSNEELASMRIADISCGSGSFLMDMTFLIRSRTRKSFKKIYTENIFGIDIENYSIERTKIILSLLALLYGEDDKFDFNLLCHDTLDYTSEDFDKNYKTFDIIVGNPPYVCSRNMTSETKEKAIKYEVCKYGRPDLYIPFIQIAIDSLSENGRMGYITMNSFFNSLNGRGLREYFDKLRFDIKIVDFKDTQIFKGKSTYTCLLFVKKNHSDSIDYSIERGENQKESKSEQLNYNNLSAEKGWNLNDYTETSFIENTGIPLGKYCKSSHGIATLCNKCFIFNPKEENENFYILEKDGRTFEIEKGVCMNAVNSNKLNSQVAFDSLIEKVIYPYERKDGKIHIMSEETLKGQFPKAYRYLISQKDVLSKRDKGNANKYPEWYAYGRTQGLNPPAYYLFFPKIANKPLRCVLTIGEGLLLFNGMAFISNERKKLEIVKKIVESEFFWNYVCANSKPYSSGFHSLNGVNIKKFGIPLLSQKQEDDLIELENRNDIERYIRKLYRCKSIERPDFCVNL